MKKYLSVLIALMVCAFASAQDTIMFRNGRVEAVKETAEAANVAKATKILATKRLFFISVIY